MGEGGRDGVRKGGTEGWRKDKSKRKGGMREWGRERGRDL